MGLMSRTKGKAGEREIAALLRDLTGWEVQRRVRQYDGDSDLVGVPGWSIEVKRYGTATRADVARWWAQTVVQAATDRPVLFYRRNRDDWRAVWPLSLELVGAVQWPAYEWSVEGSIAAWAAVARELAVDRVAATGKAIGGLAAELNRTRLIEFHGDSDGRRRS